MHEIGIGFVCCVVLCEGAVPATLDLYRHTDADQHRGTGDLERPRARCSRSARRQRRVLNACQSKRAFGEGSVCLQRTSLSEITLPPNLTKIGGSTFWGCTSLSEITLPPNLTKIEDYAFYGVHGCRARRSN